MLYSKEVCVFDSVLTRSGLAACRVISMRHITLYAEAVEAAVAVDAAL